MTQRKYDCLPILAALGFSRSDAETLRRISMTLHRWHEMECGTSSGAIVRDEKTGIPYWYNANSRYLAANDPRALISLCKAFALPHTNQAGERLTALPILPSLKGTAMPCYEPPPRTPNWLFRLAHAVLGAALFCGLIAALWVNVHIIAAIVGAL